MHWSNLYCGFFNFACNFFVHNLIFSCCEKRTVSYPVLRTTASTMRCWSQLGLLNGKITIKYFHPACQAIQLLPINLGKTENTGRCVTQSKVKMNWLALMSLFQSAVPKWKPTCQLQSTLKHRPPNLDSLTFPVEVFLANNSWLQWSYLWKLEPSCDTNCWGFFLLIFLASETDI